MGREYTVTGWQEAPEGGSDFSDLASIAEWGPNLMDLSGVPLNLTCRICSRIVREFSGIWHNEGQALNRELAALRRLCGCGAKEEVSGLPTDKNDTPTTPANFSGIRRVEASQRPTFYERLVKYGYNAEKHGSITEKFTETLRGEASRLDTIATKIEDFSGGQSVRLTNLPEGRECEPSRSPKPLFGGSEREPKPLADTIGEIDFRRVQKDSMGVSLDCRIALEKAR